MRINTFLIYILCLMLCSSPSYSSPVRTSKSLTPPTKTTAPPKISRDVPENPYRCQRTFLYQGRALGCDSFLTNDGEKLRIYFSDIPHAIQELDSYQRTRRNVQYLAFSATAGLLLWIVASSFKERYGGLEGIAIRNRYGIPGLTIFTGSVIGGWIVLSANEGKLQNAIGLHNQAHPENPIEVQVNTQLRF